jgi:Right handed beta helix region
VHRQKASGHHEPRDIPGRNRLADNFRTDESLTSGNQGSVNLVLTPVARDKDVIPCVENPVPTHNYQSQSSLYLYMTRLTQFIVLLLLVVHQNSAVTPPDVSSRQEIFVAPKGRDSNPGTKFRPVATLQQARNTARKIKAQTDDKITVMVQGGTYYLAEPLVLSPEDSGISYSAAPGETVTLSGGRKLIGQWKRFRNGILMATVPRNLPFTQLFVNGRRQNLARYPNYDPSEPGKSGTITPAADEEEWPARKLQYDPTTFTKQKWAHPEEAVVHIFARNYWGNLQWQVKSVDWIAHSIQFGRGGFQLNEIMQGRDATAIGKPSRFFVENIFEELDAEGEWYLDQRNSVLYFKPPVGVEMKTAVVEAAVLKQLIELRGTEDHPVRSITLTGFRIAHTASTFLEEYDAPSLGDWTIHRGGAVFIEGAEDCTVERFFFDAVGGNGVFLNDYTRRIRVYGNKFTEAGESAIALVGSKNRIHGTNHPFPSENLISNNLIHDCGVFGKQTAGVFVAVGEKMTISHNHIYNLPRAGICLNDGWGGGHIIEHNRVHDTVRETGDHGPFNSWGRERYWCLQQSHGPVSHGAGNVRMDSRYTTIIRNNYFRDNRGWGIDLDDGSANFLVTKNLCLGVSVKLREGDHRTVENNIFINPANPPGFHVGYEDNHDRFMRNIIVTNAKFDNPELDINFRKGEARGAIYQIIYPPLKGALMEQIDYNLFFNDVGTFFATLLTRDGKNHRYTLDEWRALGFDKNSTYGDPMFTDATKGNYRLKLESPALKLAFEEFDVSDAGLLSDFPQQ